MLTKSLSFIRSHATNLQQMGLRSLATNVSSDIKYDYDTIIVGGGIVGLSTARLLQSKYPAMKISLLEKESSLSQHQTGNNSGVIHCGIYYTPNSLKATLCVKGNQQMYDYCDTKNIKYMRSGKLIVAINSSEIQRLRDLYKNGLENNVPGLKLLENTSQIKQIEPLCDGLQAIWCETTGIVNFAEVAQSYGSDFIANGGQIHTDCEVTNFSSINRILSKDFSNGILVHTKDNKLNDANNISNVNFLRCKHVITCCGVYSDRVSQFSGASPYPCMVPIRGDYLKIKNKKLNQKLTGVNIYPVPNPVFPVLGVHFTPMFNKENKDEIEYILGPSAVFAFGRENYWFTKNINVGDVMETFSRIGFWKMVKNHWKFALSEFYRDIIFRKQVDELKKYVSELRYEDVERSFGGIRGQSMDEFGNLTDDFCIDTECNDALNAKGRFLNIRNAPSPACTSSIAIGEIIVEKATKEFNLDVYN